METGKTARAPMTGAGYDWPARLRELPIGTRFMAYTETLNWGLPDEARHGTLLWPHDCSCEVIWDGSKDSCRVQSELDVYIVDEEPLGWMLTEQYFWQNTNYPGKGSEEEKVDMAEQQAAMNNAAKALIARYNFQLTKLAEALEGDNKAQASVTMTRIEKCIFEAKQTNVVLPDPSDALKAYGPLEEALAKAAEERKAKATAANAVTEAAKGDPHVARAVAVEKHKDANKAPREPKAPKDKKLRPCLDGCGQMVPGNFAMGHDAKLKSLLLKIERGDVGLDAIPEICLDLVTIIKGEPVQPMDSEGKPKGEPKPTFRITAAPVRFPGRDDVRLTKRED